MKKIFIGLLSFSPALAIADVDFYTYGGYETVVNGFTYMRNVYGNAQYGLLVFTILAMAIFISASLNSIKGLTGQGKASQMLSSIFFCCLGFAIYQGTIIPKTTVHVYDTVLNKYEPVGDVPLLIATLAAGVNILERVGSGTFAATTINREEHGGGATIQLLSTILNQDPLKYQPYLSKSIEHYIDDCMPPALTSNVGSYATFDLDKILHSTDNLVAELEKLASTYQMTVYYDAANRGGVPVTCNASWASIKALIELPSTYDDHYADACNVGGFESDTAACKARLDDISDFVMDTTGAINTSTIAANQALAQNLYRNLAENPVAYMQDMINMKNQSAGLSTLVAAGSWLPTIRYSTMMIIVGIMPLITLMFFTPMLGIAFKYTAGLLLFVGVWGLTDTAIHGITLGNIENQLASLQTTDFSVYTFMTAPNELQKAVATMGKMQSMGLILATILVGIFFKISGHAFSNMGEKLQGDIDKIGGETGREVFDPSTRMSTIDSYSQASYKIQNLGDMGTEGYAASTSKPIYSQQQEDYRYMQGIGGTPTQAMNQQAAMRAGEQVGTTQKTQQTADLNDLSMQGYATQLAAERTQNTLEDTHSTHDANAATTAYTPFSNNIETQTALKAADQARQAGNAEVLGNIKTATGVDNYVDAALKQANANVQFVASADELQTMQDEGGNVNPQSIAQARSNGGAVATVSFNPDEYGANPINVGTRTESSASFDNSTTVKEGTDASAGSIPKLLTTRDGEIVLEEGEILANQALSGDLPTQMSVINGLSESAMGRITASDSDSSNKSVNAGVSGDIPLTGLIGGGLGMLQKGADLFGGGSVELPDGIGGTRTKPGRNDKAFGKATDLVDKYVPGVDINAGANWTGTNRDSDSREIETKAFFGYVMQEYEEQYKAAQSAAERESIANEWAVVNDILLDSINAYSMNMAGDNIQDLNQDGSFFGESVSDQMDDLRELREDQQIPR